MAELIEASNKVYYFPGMSLPSDTSPVYYLRVLFPKKKKSDTPDPLQGAFCVPDASYLEGKEGMLFVLTEDSETYMTITKWYKSIANNSVGTLSERFNLIQDKLVGRTYSIFLRPPTKEEGAKVTWMYYDITTSKCDTILPHNNFTKQFVVCCGGEKLMQGAPTNFVFFGPK